jgi:hypothetical protein
VAIPEQQCGRNDVAEMPANDPSQPVDEGTHVKRALRAIALLSFGAADIVVLMPAHDPLTSSCELRNRCSF